MPEDKEVDLERCVTASMDQSNGCQPSSGSKTGRNCAIAVQYLDGRAVLINATITEEAGGELVFSSAKKQISRVVTTKWHQRLIGKLLMGLVVGTARVKQVIQCGPQPRSRGNQGPPISPPRVYLQDFTLDPLLTEALHNPQLPLHPAAYSLNADYSGSSPADNDKALCHQPFSNDVDSNSIITCIEHDGQEIIVVRSVIDRAKVAWLLILLLLFSPALGIGVGICSHNADVGIAVSAGVFALASFVQGLVAWIQG